jgi:hypothetical protein
MKLSSVLLAGSLVANAALIALFIAGASGGTTSPATTPTDSRPAAKAPIAGEANAAVDPAAWANLTPEKPATLLARLRAAGFPPAMIRALIAEQVRVQFAPQRAALNLKAKERPYWEPATHDPKTDAALREITKEQDKVIKDILGPDADTDETALALLHRQFPNLSDEKIAAIQRAEQVRNEKNQDIVANLPNGMFNAADLAGPKKELLTEIAKLLTPQELEDYDLRTNNTTAALRSQLATFNPTEQEFRALYQLQRPFDEQYQLNMVGGMLTDQQRQLLNQRAEAQNRLSAQIQAALGDQRYADYLRSSDYNYQQTSRLVARLELPTETATQVYAVQQDLQQRARTVQLDRTLAPEDRTAQLAALAAEAQTKVSAALGPNGYEAYKQNGGQWLQNLQPRPVSAPRPAISAGGGGGG